jgi:hypothetical protein
MGRPSKVNEVVSIMAQNVRLSKMSVKQMHTQRSYVKDAKDLMTKAQVNQLQLLPKLSKRTWTRAYAKSCGTKKVKVSSAFSDRAFNLMNWRNPISCVCTWNVCLKVGKVSPCDIWSGDDVAVILNPMQGRLQVVRLTKEEHAALKAKHLTPGCRKERDALPEALNVVCKMFASINAEGTRGPVVAKLLDHDFRWPNPDKWMDIYPANESMHLFVACVNKSHSKHCEITYFEKLFTLVLIPHFVAHHKAKRGTARFTCKGLNSPVQAEVELEMEDGARIIFAMDSLYQGIEAIITRVGALMQAAGIEVFKWAAGCTDSQQPADVADCHKRAHREAASDAVTYDEHGAPTEEMQEFIKLFRTLGTTGARLHTHEKFLRHFEWLVDSAWTKRSITEGFRVSGIWPFSASNILSTWPGWKYIPTEKAKIIVDLCTDCDGDAFHEVLKNGFLDDLTAETIFGSHIEDEEFKEYMKDKDWDVSPVHQRCLLLTSKLFDSASSYMQGIQLQRRELEQRVAAAHGEVRDGVQYCVCGAKLPKDVEKHLGTKLHETNCRRKGIWVESSGQAAPQTPQLNAAPSTPDWFAPPPAHGIYMNARTRMSFYGDCDESRKTLDRELVGAYCFEHEELE